MTHPGLRNLDDDYSPGWYAPDDDPDWDDEEDPDEDWDDEDIEWPADVVDSRLTDLGGQGLTLIQLHTMTDIPLTGGYL
jgi:hypothetical protein